MKTEERKKEIAGADLLLIVFGAEGGTRTPTGFLPLPPQSSVSTSSTTSAKNLFALPRRLFRLGLRLFLKRDAAGDRGWRWGWSGDSSRPLRHQSTITQSTRLCQDIVCKRSDEKNSGQSGGDAHKETTCASASEHGTGTAAENNPHPLLSGLKQDEEDQKNAGKNMDRQHNCLQRFLLSWTCAAD